MNNDSALIMIRSIQETGRSLERANALSATRLRLNKEWQEALEASVDFRISQPAIDKTSSSIGGLAESVDGLTASIS